MSRFLITLALVVLCIAGVHGVSSRLRTPAKSRLRHLASKPIKTLLVDSTSVAQLYASTDATVLAEEVAAGTVFKSSTTMIAWQAASTSSQTVKEIHALAGGETGVVSGRTWVFDCSSWSGFADWVENVDATDLASYGTINTDTSIVTWEVPLLEANEPTTAQCESYATAIAATDLASAMLVAADFYTQELNLDSSSTAYASLSELASGATLKAERFDSTCIGYKFFSYYDAPTTTTTSSTQGAFSD